MRPVLATYLSDYSLIDYFLQCTQKNSQKPMGGFNPKPPLCYATYCVWRFMTLYKKLNFDLWQHLCLTVKPYTVLAMSNHSSDIDSLTLYYCTSGVSKLRPAGQIRPAKVSNPARGALLENRSMGRKQ